MSQKVVLRVIAAGMAAEAELDGLVGVDTKMRGYARRTVRILSTSFYERFFCIGLPDEKDRFLVGLYQTPTLLIVFSYRSEATVMETKIDPN